MNALAYRLSYRVGQWEGRGWPFTWFMRKDIALMREASSELLRMDIELADARAHAERLRSEGRPVW